MQSDSTMCAASGNLKGRHFLKLEKCQQKFATPRVASTMQISEWATFKLNMQISSAATACCQQLLALGRKGKKEWLSSLPLK